MADELRPAEHDDNHEYEPPKLTVLGTVRQLASEVDVSEVPK
jgi:hypothetical protein